eukprot:gene31487-38889_t
MVDNSQVTSVLNIIRKNQREIACIASHLVAIHTAVNDPLYDLVSSPYALIVEDDVHFELNVDFDALAMHAPGDFSILQLSTNNGPEASKMWRNFVNDSTVPRDKSQSMKDRSANLTRSTDNRHLRFVSPVERESVSMWRPRHTSDSSASLWSTQAYLVHRERVRAVVDQMVTISPHTGAETSVSASHVCCRRIVADSYLYALFRPAYVSRIPMFNVVAKLGSRSTIKPKGGNDDSQFMVHYLKIEEVLKDVAFVAPDTSPRGANIPTEDDSWDFGTGAGFYLDATAEPWSTNYNMYTYITKELPELLAEQFTALDMNRVSITGHSMGGHGALTIAIKNQSAYKSVSAFSPICNPSQCPWGVKAFTGYLGEDRTQWSAYDATELLLAAEITRFDDILIDVGTADSFLKGGQLLPEAFQQAAGKVGQKVTLRLQEGYDHSYFFISTFVEDHVDFHAQRLNA